MSRASAFPASTNAGGGGGSAHTEHTVPGEKSYFEVQREGLMRDIGVSMENVLQNINKLNRSLEGIISVGNEFSSVEALWSHFENVMAKDAGGNGGADGGAAASANAVAGEQDEVVRNARSSE